MTFAPLLAANPAGAAGMLSEQAARAKGVSILLGDPYGKTRAAVGEAIRDAELHKDGETRACGTVKHAAWEFHVVVVTPDKDAYDNGVIDGYLALDARDGKLLCTNLPLLD